MIGLALCLTLVRCDWHALWSRTGRVREGFAYHLFLRRELQEMPAQQLPEMLRCPLESIALRIKTLRKGKIGEFLSKAIEPPSQKAIRHVIDVLRGLSALDTIPPSVGATVSSETQQDAQHSHGLEELTPLGTLLAQLPVDPRIGKMMLFGAIFRCLESTLVIAASLAFRSPFFSPFDKRAEVCLWGGHCSKVTECAFLLRAFRFTVIVADGGYHATVFFYFLRRFFSKWAGRQSKKVLRARAVRSPYAPSRL